jgi:hypothetical protein
MQQNQDMAGMSLATSPILAQKPDTADRKITARQKYNQLVQATANTFSKKKGSKTSPPKQRHP